MSDVYNKVLLAKLVGDSPWMPNDFTEDFEKLVRQVEREVDTTSISGKIASIFVKHQVVHEFVKDLIGLSHIYVQGEIWPTRISPKYDGGKDKMTGWYIDYFASNCIDCVGKNNFLKHARKLNEIRNKVAHNMSGKNEVVINNSYKKFEEHFQGALFSYNDECFPYMVRIIDDLTNRVDFEELLND